MTEVLYQLFEFDEMVVVCYQRRLWCVVYENSSKAGLKDFLEKIPRILFQEFPAQKIISLNGQRLDFRINL